MYRNFYNCSKCRWMWSREQTCKTDMCPKCKTMNTATSVLRIGTEGEEDFERRFRDRQAKKRDKRNVDSEGGPKAS